MIKSKLSPLKNAFCLWLFAAISASSFLASSAHAIEPAGQPPIAISGSAAKCGALLSGGSIEFAGSSKEEILERKTWTLGGGVTVEFKSNTPFHLTREDLVNLSAHLPGFRECSSGTCRPNLFLNHIEGDSSSIRLEQQRGAVTISARWGSKLPPDFIHLLYGAARKEWLNNRIYPVHAACIGNEKDGYVLLVGAPGSGKTSLALNHAIHHGMKIFSGDKTLITIGSNGVMEAIAGTKTITVRSQDIGRWSAVKKMNAHQFGDRISFQLPSEFYAKSPRVPIKKIFLVGLNDGVQDYSELSSMSALHTLYPFFMDKQREDILIGGDRAIFDGTTGADVRAGLSRELLSSLQNIPVYKVTASLNGVTSFIRRQHRTTAPGKANPEADTPRKILFGICGIGNGHISRQLPVLRHFLDQGDQVMVFTYGEGIAFFRNRYPHYPNLKVVEVANPYYVGTSSGLDFEQTARSDKNKVDVNRINAEAMSQAAKSFGNPDLVISDYELVSAQYAYAKRTKLVTLDQQSKYLAGQFPDDLAGTTYLDEVERLSMFFPIAKKRIAVSFFDVKPAQGNTDQDVDILPPMIRPEIIAAKGSPKSAKPSVLVYVTAQQSGNQPIDQWMRIIASTIPENFEAHVFLPARFELPGNTENVRFYRHGESGFDSILIASHGIISTAGHTLLSESMYLGKPVYALPLPIYEQQLNARIIAENKFGISEPSITESGLRTFLANLETYSENIRNDRKVLLKEPGNSLVIEEIERIINSK
ncbi:MAG: hypothetical protein IPK68_18940 [Bdellovibrionales bacterium]|nr:hypothetical protein [Bdellovibrionales bacterium]